VRSLAGRAAASAKEIKLLIDNSTVQVDAGAALVAQAGGIIQDMERSVKNVSTIVGEIAVATGEQSGRIGAISLVVKQLDDTLQQNAAMVEESAGASENLKDQARKLTDIVRTFRLSRTESARLPSACALQVSMAPGRPRSTDARLLLNMPAQ
jgi:methyl-accepting chemotaxis protein